MVFRALLSTWPALDAWLLTGLGLVAALAVRQRRKGAAPRLRRQPGFTVWDLTGTVDGQGWGTDITIRSAEVSLDEAADLADRLLGGPQIWLAPNVQFYSSWLAIRSGVWVDGWRIQIRAVDLEPLMTLHEIEDMVRAGGTLPDEGAVTGRWRLGELTDIQPLHDLDLVRRPDVLRHLAGFEIDLGLECLLRLDGLLRLTGPPGVPGAGLLHVLPGAHPGAGAAPAGAVGRAAGGHHRPPASAYLYAWARPLQAVEQYLAPFRAGVNHLGQMTHFCGSLGAFAVAAMAPPSVPSVLMARFIVQVITDEIELVELLWYGREPYHDWDRMIERDDPMPLDEAFRVSGLCSSLSDARRLIAQGGAYVQGERCGSDGEFWSRVMYHDRYLLLRKGKRSIALLEVIPVMAVAET